MRTFSVKNFEKFQHYKDRAPPWIKLYNELLDDYDFGRLQDASKMHLIAIWLLASRSENKIPYDPTWVARRINATDPVDLDALAAAGFIIVDQPLQTAEQDASKSLAKCLPRDREEGETEERRGETESLTGRDAPSEEFSEAAVFKFGKTVLGKSAGGVITSLKKHFSHDLRQVKHSLQQASEKENPMEWVQAVLRKNEFDPYRGAI